MSTKRNTEDKLSLRNISSLVNELKPGAYRLSDGEFFFDKKDGRNQLAEAFFSKDSAPVWYSLTSDQCEPAEQETAQDPTPTERTNEEN